MNKSDILVSDKPNIEKAHAATSPEIMQTEMAQIDKDIGVLEGKLKRIRSISESSQKSLDKSNQSVSPHENNSAPQFPRQISFKSENSPETEDAMKNVIQGVEDIYSRSNSKLEPVLEDTTTDRENKFRPRSFPRSVSFSQNEIPSNQKSPITPEENEEIPMRTRKISCSSCGQQNEIPVENRKSQTLSQKSQTSQEKFDNSSENEVFSNLQPLMENAKNLELHTQNSQSSQKSFEQIKNNKYKFYIVGIIIIVVLLLGILAIVIVQLSGSNKKEGPTETASSRLVNSPPDRSNFCNRLPKLENGFSKCDVRNTSCNISCDRGFHLKHKFQTQILCGANGDWNLNNTCTKKHCEDSQDKNGKIVCKKSVCKITCNSGYVVEGDDEADCFDGELYPALACQKQTCEKPPTPEYSWPLKASWINGSKCDQEMYYFNEKCFTDCKWGRKDETKTTIRCQIDGTWSNEALCNPPTRFCDELPKSEHSLNCIGRSVCKEKRGDICIKKSYEPETSCRLECKNNQISDPVLCLDNGTWNKKLDEKTCTDTCQQISIKDSFASCNSSQETKGIPKNTVCKVWCYAGFKMRKNGKPIVQPLEVQCNNGGTWNTSWSSITCEENVFMLIGGEAQGREVTAVEVFPPGKNKIPNLPSPLRWGAAGLINEKVFYCGGEMDGLQSSDCFKLSRGKWTNTTQLSSGGSKFAYAGVHNSLIVFNGYTASKLQDWTTSTIECITESKTQKLDENDTFSPVQSSAAVLPDGTVIVTGGKKRERKATMFTFNVGLKMVIESINKKIPLPDMNIGRMGHASTYMVLKQGQECASSLDSGKCGEIRKLIVAGGWNQRRGFMSSVEMFDLDKGNKWIHLKQHDMPQRRTDFALVVIGGKLTAIGGFHIKVVGRKKVNVYPGIIQLDVEGQIMRWTNATNMTMAVPRSGFSVAEIPKLENY